MTAAFPHRPPPAIGELFRTDHAGRRVAVHGWDGGHAELPDTDDATWYGFVRVGPCDVASADFTLTLSAGQYFALPGPARLAGGAGFAVGIAAGDDGHRALPAVGGPIESVGRLRYIDGCTDTLLLAPARLGDPCLNALYFPPATDQTPHTHPSLRAGVVAAGAGECVTPDGVTPLTPGTVFLIPPHRRHAFRTGPAAGETDAAAPALTVIAFHPDTDTGPTDEDHPMRNRTILNGN